MKAEAFLSRLEKVRESVTGSWLACCPAHDDKTPSLAVRELDDGRLLIHCFAGCSVEKVISALGLDFDALFPDTRYTIPSRGLQRPWNPSIVLKALAADALYIAVCSSDMARGITLEAAEHERLMQAVARIQDGRRLALGDGD